MNGLIIQSPALVLLLAAMIAAAISFAAAIIALYFKDRERAQFVYSIVLVISVGGSYFLNSSPVRLITRLAAGVPNIGVFEVMLYLALLFIIGLAFFKVSERLVLAR